MGVFISLPSSSLTDRSYQLALFRFCSYVTHQCYAGCPVTWIILLSFFLSIAISDMRNIPYSPPGRAGFIKANGFGYGSPAQGKSPPPVPLQNPQEGDTVSIGGSSARPFHPSILDFHLKSPNEPQLFACRFPIEELFDTPGASPKELMKEYKKTLHEQVDHTKTDLPSSEPYLRWIHLPFNSVRYAEVG